MATVNSALTKVRAVKPATFTDEQMTGWLSDLDGEISLEPLGQAEVVSYSFPEDGDTELLVPAPYDNLYVLYLFAMIDYHNDEMDRYTNSYIMFNSALSGWKKHYLRTNTPLIRAVFSNVI